MRRVLPADEVHVWQAELAMPDLSLLSPDERARADRFRAPEDRDRFVAARACLRRILAEYTGIGADRLRFGYSPLGKPRLNTASGLPALEFNLSHSGEMALIVLALGRRAGIDVERISAVSDDDERLSPLWLCAEELEELRGMQATARTHAFYSAWTRKEAYLKARGEGLSGSPDQVRVGLSRETGWHSSLEPHASDRWSLCELPVGPGYAAALAVEGFDWRLVRLEAQPATSLATCSAIAGAAVRPGESIPIKL